MKTERATDLTKSNPQTEPKEGVFFKKMQNPHLDTGFTVTDNKEVYLP